MEKSKECPNNNPQPQAYFVVGAETRILICYCADGEKNIYSIGLNFEDQ